MIRFESTRGKKIDGIKPNLIGNIRWEKKSIETLHKKADKGVACRVHPPLLSTCLHLTKSGCGKERRTLTGPWRPFKAALVRNYLVVYWPCGRGLSAVNAIATQLGDSMNSGLTRWLMAVSNKEMDAAKEVGRNPVSKHQIKPVYGDEQADARRDCRTRIVIPNSQARTRTGKCLFSLFS